MKRSVSWPAAAPRATSSRDTLWCNAIRISLTVARATDASHRATNGLSGGLSRYRSRCTQVRDEMALRVATMIGKPVAPMFRRAGDRAREASDVANCGGRRRWRWVV